MSRNKRSSKNMSKLYKSEMVDNTTSRMQDSKQPSFSELAGSKSVRESVAGHGAIPQKPD